MRIRRNDPCPCGSGRKYKHCHVDDPRALATLSPKMTGPSESLATSEPIVRKHRECDGCKACCGPSLRINEPNLVKPRDEDCRHLCDRGCLIWGPTLPQVCRDYMCNYLLEPTPLTLQERPDRLGAIIHDRERDLTHIAESAPGGLHRILQNRFWGPMIRRNMLAGRTLTASFLNDPYNSETIHMKWLGSSLGCELTSCDDQGNPLVLVISPVYEREIYSAHFIPDQNYAFDAEVLIQYLGDRDHAVIAPSQTTDDAPKIRFRISRRQADFLQALLDFLRGGRKAMSTVSTAGTR